MPSNESLVSSFGALIGKLQYVKHVAFFWDTWYYFIFDIFYKIDSKYVKSGFVVFHFTDFAFLLL